MTSQTPNLSQRAEEIWVHTIIPEYLVSNLGRVSGKRKKFLIPQITVYGYGRVCLRNRNFKVYKTVHSLVMEAFVGKRPKGMTINHKDSNKLNNRLDNLEYMTLQDNLKHGWNHGRKREGDSHGRRKLNSIEVGEIRQLYRRGNRSQLAKTYGVCPEHITKIISGGAWKALASGSGEGK